MNEKSSGLRFSSRILCKQSLGKLVWGEVLNAVAQRVAVVQERRMCG